MYCIVYVQNFIYETLPSQYEFFGCIFAQEFHQVQAIWPTFLCHLLMFSWAGLLRLSIRLVSQATRWPCSSLSFPAPLLSMWLGWTEESFTVPLCLPQTLEVDSLMRANQCVSHLKVIHAYIVYCTYKKTVMLKPISQYDAGTASVTSVMSVTGKGMLNFSTIWLVGCWLTLAMQHWNKNQVYSSVHPNAHEADATVILWTRL